MKSKKVKITTYTIALFLSCRRHTLNKSEHEPNDIIYVTVAQKGLSRIYTCSYGNCLIVDNFLTFSREDAIR